MGTGVGLSFLTVGSPTAAAKILSDQDSERKGMNRGLNSDKNVQATTNKVNEITGITNSAGATWATPTEALEIRRAGDVNPLMFQSESRRIRALTYPARLSTSLNLPKDTYTSGTLTKARHDYYTPGWQCVEERVGTSTTLERQFVWALRFFARTVSFEW